MRKAITLSLTIVIFLLAAFWPLGIFTESRPVALQAESFVQSSKALRNADRGFYGIYGFAISEEETPYAEIERDVLQRIDPDDTSVLAMLQLNISAFQRGPVTPGGLANIRAVLKAMCEHTQMRFIVRVLYDWDGQIRQTEPDDANLISQHIRQVCVVLNEFSSRLFTLQGLFIGNWGELNGSAHLSPEELCLFAGVMDETLAPRVFMAVRTPAQLRTILGFADNGARKYNGLLGKRLGLFNDGIMGNELDCGSYTLKKKAEAGMLTGWTRTEELDFQEVLCRKVPNGGEVIIDNPLNDFANAVAVMKHMHVSYLNREYDLQVLEKWRGTIIRDGSCFDGMDGLTYVERCLGYRYYIDRAGLERSIASRWAVASVSIGNAGFAPAYAPLEASLLVTDASGTLVLCERFPDALQLLTGSAEPEQRQVFSTRIDLGKLAAGEYHVWFRCIEMWDRKLVLFANEQTEDPELGLMIGRLVIEDE